MSSDPRLFDIWMGKVDDELDKIAGCAHDDLIDCPYADWYDIDGYSPKEAAIKALEWEEDS